jgi:hypothetical protein
LLLRLQGRSKSKSPVAPFFKGGKSSSRRMQERHRRVGVLGFGAQQGQMRERRKARRFALRQFGLGERGIAAVEQQLQKRMVGMMRLQQHLAGFVGTTGAAGDLDQQLRDLLAGAEVGREQALVDADHGD